MAQAIRRPHSALQLALLMPLVAFPVFTTAEPSNPRLCVQHAAPVKQDTAPAGPLFVETAVVDRKGKIVDDMKTSDFRVTVDGKPRVVVSLSRLYRGPGASRMAATWQEAMPTAEPPRIEPSRVLLFVVDQGSLLPGDEARVGAITESCLGLLGLGDQLGVAVLPHLRASMPVQREAIRTALVGVKGLRGLDDSPIAALEDAPSRPDPLETVQPTNPARERAQTPPATFDARPQPLENLQEAVSAGKLSERETLSATAAKSQAVATLAGLEQLLDMLRHMPGAKTILLLSAGIAADDVSDQIDRTARAASVANTRIYALQVPTAARKFAEIGESGLVAIARASGGALVRLERKPGEALQSMVSELSFSYLLMLEPSADNQTSVPQSLSVTTKRKGTAIRSCEWLAAGRLLPDVRPAPRPAAPSAAPRARAQRRDAALDAVLARAADYVQNYWREMSAVVAEEVYEQRVMARMAGAGVVEGIPLESIRLVSDFLLVKIPGGDGWLPFRDVFEVNGEPVRERENRLQKLFLEAPTAKAVENANSIWEQSARYNIGPVRRDLNVPTLALMFLTAENTGRFAFSRRSEEDDGGMRTWVVEYRETARPTIIKTSAHADVPASGRLWIEPTSGRVVQTTLEAGSASITVIYRPGKDTPGLWVPTSMDERYGRTILARATYSKIRRFRVFTEEKIKEPKDGKR